MAKTTKVVRQASPADYANLFETTPRGKLVFESLIRQFNKPPVYEGGIDGVRKSDVRAGERAVINFIVNMINRNNGVQDEPEENVP